MSPVRVRLHDEGNFTSAAPVGQPIGNPIAMSRTAEHRALEDRNATTGIWECSPGQFRRQVAEAEYSYIVSGEGSFTPDDGHPIEFRGGDALYFEANSQGVWDIRQTVRKTYLILS
ncbi:TPA: cupin domain-containing protein [Pseudomonas aeruginosa]|uniref:cupin domain-containing protein n=1 Tax=Pseudomonas TaxID=286 RepID=UPI000CD4125D|nr:MULTISPECIES: cupin domain-containing protein [Pseudomonas]MBI8577285.1 cupin domain-containing protein [Pseudomonas aeruginosa]MBI8804340.1 cupin domain-containing protein [Pseudomonas aeruginosa]MCU9210301.1 cupin domain-containing protein [Pseudomonas aeruginosa]MDA3374400.1 cupin domain-containing protein [Pseudomonas aeruginosa]MDD2005010.1 cupin domain-containing protein [Pseudomonas putida]